MYTKNLQRSKEVFINISVFTRIIGRMVQEEGENERPN